MHESMVCAIITAFAKPAEEVMSVEVLVACIAPLPHRDDDWSFTIGPVTVNRVGRGETDRFARARVLVPGVRDILIFSSHASTADVGEGLAHRTAQMIGGAALYEDGPTLLAVFNSPFHALSAKNIHERLEAYVHPTSDRAR